MTAEIEVLIELAGKGRPPVVGKVKRLLRAIHGHITAKNFEKIKLCVDLRQIIIEEGMDTDNQTVSDRRLLAEYKAGSAEAFSEIAARHSAMVYSVCYRVLEDVQRAEDATQAAFLFLARKGATLRDDINLASWLYITAQKSALQLRRAEQRRLRHERSVVYTSPNDSTESTWDEVRPHLDDALASLPPSQRDALVLHFIKGMSYDDAAQTMACSVDTFNSRVRYGLTKLRSKLRSRSIVLSTAGLMAMLSGKTTENLPSGLKAIVAAACSAQAPHSVSLAALETAHALSRLWFWTKLKTAALVASLIVALATPFALHALRQQAAATQPSLAQTPVAPLPTTTLPAPAARVVDVVDNDGMHLDDSRLWKIESKFPLHATATQIELPIKNVGPDAFDGPEVKHYKAWNLADGPVSLKLTCNMDPRLNAATLKLVGFLNSPAEDISGTARPLQSVTVILQNGNHSVGVVQDLPGISYKEKKAHVDPVPSHTLELIVSNSEAISIVDGKVLERNALGMDAKMVRFTINAKTREQHEDLFATISDVKIGPASTSPAETSESRQF